MKAKILLLPLLLLPVVGGCTSTSGDGYTTGSDAFGTHINGNMHLDFDNDGLVVKAGGRPDAHVGANGDLRIGDKAVAVTPAQRALLVRYYGEAVNVRDDGIAIGKAGAALGVKAVSNVVESLFSDDHHGNDAGMKANSDKIDVTAQKMCDDMLRIRSTQGEIASQLPAFAPYAVFRGELHCDKHDSTASG